MLFSTVFILIIKQTCKLCQSHQLVTFVLSSFPIPTKHMRPNLETFAEINVYWVLVFLSIVLVLVFENLQRGITCKVSVKQDRDNLLKLVIQFFIYNLHPRAVKVVKNIAMLAVQRHC